MVGDVADLAAWVDEMSRVLAPGGHLVYSDFHPVWAAHGWRRTFRTLAGRVVELAYSVHPIDEHRTRLEEHGFDVCQIREQGLSGDIGSAAHNAGPVVVVLHAVKKRSESVVTKARLAGVWPR